MFFSFHNYASASLSSHSYNGPHTFNTTAQSANSSTTVVPLDIAHGGTGKTSLTAFTLLTGGITTTNQIQSLPSGTAGQILTSSGAGALPVWNDATIIVLVLNLSNNQIKNLHAIPVVLLPAPGSGKIIEVLRCKVKLNYGGNNPFIASDAQTIRLNYTSSSGPLIILTIATNEFIVSSSVKILGVINGGQSIIDYSEIVNQPIVIFNPVATEISGNAANDNTISLELTYQIIDI